MFDDGTKLTLLNITATLVELFYHMEPDIELSSCYLPCICSHDALYWTLDILLWVIFNCVTLRTLEIVEQPQKQPQIKGLFLDQLLGASLQLTVRCL